MGCLLAKQPQEEKEMSKEEKVSEVSCWKILEWENTLRNTDLAMDQINLELKQDILREQEGLFQQRNRNLEDDRGNLQEAQIQLLEEETC